jgi:Fe-S-cluster containining protein
MAADFKPDQVGLNRSRCSECEIPMGIIRKNGFDFGFDPSACADCPSHCCRGESGNVWVNQQEIRQICRFLNTEPIDCIQLYLIQIDNRLSIKERRTSEGDLECVFLEGTDKKCSIYAVRPRQCRRYPFWNEFRGHKDEVSKECPGIRE